MVRHSRDGLPDGGESFGVHQCLIVSRFFDCECRLVRDGHGELQVVVGEFRCGRSAAVRIEEERADHLVAAAHRHAKYLADVVPRDALAAAEPIVGCRVGNENPLAFAHDVFDDGTADAEGFRNAAITCPHRLRHRHARLGIDDHETTLIGVGRMQDQAHDPFEQFIDIEDVANCVRSFVHHRKIG